MLAAVFARHAVYGSPQAFIDGFTPALWVGAGLSALGMLAALLTPGRRSLDRAIAPARAAAALTGEPA